MRLDAEALHKPQGVAVRIVDVPLARAPALIDGALVNLAGRVRIPGCLQPSPAEPAKHGIHIVRQYDDRLSERTVPAVAREKQQRSSPQERTAGGVVITAVLDTLKVEHFCIEGKRRFHA